MEYKIKNRKMVWYIVLGLMLIFSLTVYAQSSRASGELEYKAYHMKYLDVKAMDEMHKLMTENLDPELQKSMDEMHRACIN
jgi:hypothetical protein